MTTKTSFEKRIPKKYRKAIKEVKVTVDARLHLRGYEIILNDGYTTAYGESYILENSQSDALEQLRKIIEIKVKNDVEIEGTVENTTIEELQDVVARYCTEAESMGLNSIEQCAVNLLKKEITALTACRANNRHHLTQAMLYLSNIKALQSDNPIILAHSISCLKMMESLTQ